MKTTPASVPPEVLQVWEEREFLDSYQTIGSDRRRLYEIRRYRVTKYERRKYVDPANGAPYEETVEIHCREERILTQVI